MTTKELKEWLWEANNINSEIEQLDLARQKAFTLACKNNAMEKHTAEYADYSNAIDENINRLFEMQSKIIKAIKLCDNSIYRQILSARYINGSTFEEISVDTGYCYRQVIRLHGQALQHLAKKMSLNVT